VSQKKIVLLGSTGSIGRNTLKVVRHLGDRVRVVGLAAHTSIDLLEEQAGEFGVKRVAVCDLEAADRLRCRNSELEVLSGMEGVCALAATEEADLVVAAQVGSSGVLPVCHAIEAGKDVALANKETLVAAGGYVIPLAQEKGVSILPIDSEHSALFQALHGEDPSRVRKLILTASGGPFWHHSLQELQGLDVQRALSHPNYPMGQKNTIDSSTLMNKGLEVMEAHWLFGVPVERIEVVVHPQQIIHSMVEFVDGSIIAQMGPPDMLLPIQYALTYPERWPSLLTPFDFTRTHRLDFYPPDCERFQCLDLAYQALTTGHSAPCYLNAANEELVNQFLDKQFEWLEIGKRLERLMNSHRVETVTSIDSILEIDRRARRDVKGLA
jgi:1-deoxy-D-xylulose-5-phosphate reductoisomerase